MAEWEIKKTVGKCVATDHEFEVGEEYFASLVSTEEGLVRQDFCVDYWNEHHPEVYCFWKSKMPHPEQKKKKLFVDDAMLMAFFDRLEEETEKQKIDFRFVLMLILMRKRKLKYESSRLEKGQTEDDHSTEIWTLKVTGQDRTVDVVNPHLDEDQIEELSGQMGQILNSDLEE